MGIMAEEKSEIHINNVSLERELQTEKNFFLLEAILFHNLDSGNTWGYCGEQC